METRSATRGGLCGPALRTTGALLALLLAAACGSEPAMPPVQAPLEIEITAKDFEWHVRYPGRDGKLRTDDDILALRDLHVPSGVPTRLRLRSKDYIYTLHLPRQGEKEVAIPGMDFELFFTEADEGEYPLRGDQMCGFSHKSLIGRLYVEPEERFLRALQAMQKE